VFSNRGGIAAVNTFDFRQEFAAADTEQVHARVEKFVRQRFPDVLSVQRAARANDRAGADINLEFGHGQFRFIDIKVRKVDYRRFGRPDVALEVVSNKERGSPGWALDDSKLTDYTLFIWQDTGRVVMFDARALRAVTRSNLPRWSKANQHADQRTAVRDGQYTSSVVFVSSDELATLIARWQGVAIAAS
jgi:hypothetical protein